MNIAAAGDGDRRRVAEVAVQDVGHGGLAGAGIGASTCEGYRPGERSEHPPRRFSDAIPLMADPAAVQRAGRLRASDAAAPASVRERSLAILRDVFGHAAFRGAQGEIVDHVAAGGDALVLLPTGGGKSVCYPVPALVRGPGIVVSPLIALMQDQVEAAAPGRRPRGGPQLAR